MSDIRQTVAVIAGLGNVGSKLARRLTEVGFHSFVFVDFDKVESRNLRTCGDMFTSSDLGRPKVEVVRRLLECALCSVMTRNDSVENLGLGMIRAHKPAVLFGAVDNRAARLELTRFSVRLGLPLVDLAIDGQPSEVTACVRVTAPSTRRPCLIEAWNARDFALLDRVASCSDEAVINQGNEPSHPVASSAAGHLAARLGAEAGARLLAGDDSDVGYELRVDQKRDSQLRVRLPRLDPCPLDHDLQIRNPHLLFGTRSIGDLFSAAIRLAGPETVVHLERDVAENPICRECGVMRRGLFAAPGAVVSASCLSCGGRLASTALHNTIDTTLAGRHEDALLCEAGIPGNDIVRVERGGASIWLELTNGRRA